MCTAKKGLIEVRGFSLHRFASDYCIPCRLIRTSRRCRSLTQVWRFVSQEEAQGRCAFSFDFRTAFNETATRMMTAGLRNQQPDSENA